MEGNTLKFQLVTTLTEEDNIAIMDLWNQEYPASLSYASLTDFENYIKGLLAPIHILVRNDHHLVGWAAKFDREDQRWFVIILSSIITRKRLGNKPN